MMERWARIRSYAGVFLVASLIALSVRLFLLEDYRIASASMVPNLVKGDLVFVSKSAYNLRLPFSTYELVRFRLPRPGEVVAFTLPGKAGGTFVKRVVALEGDTLEIRRGRVSVNGEPAKYRKIEGAPAADSTRSVASQGAVEWETLEGGTDHLIRVDPRASYGPIVVPKDHFFALGDNRPESVDARVWGPIPLSSLKGRVTYIWLSVDNSGTLRPGRAGTRIP
jgi:signal peptidase I